MIMESREELVKLQSNVKNDDENNEKWQEEDTARYQRNDKGKEQ
jgi:hypothetical protein